MFAPLTSSDAIALLSPSAQVLTASARIDGGTGIAALLPWHEVHWPTLVALASFERAEVQLDRLLRAAPPGAVPDDVLQAMQAVHRVARFRAAELADAAGAAVDTLHAHGIDALWLKGAAMAMQHSAGFSLRGMGDLDVLVEPAQLAPARVALRQAGWSDGAEPASYASHHHDAPMLRPGGLRLELHTALFPPGHPFTQEPARAWLDRARQVHWQGRVARVLPAAWHLIHASTHWAWSHAGEIGSWQYLHDVPLLSSEWTLGGPEWNDVHKSSERLGASRPVGWALWTAARLSSATIDEPLLERLRGRPEFGRPLTEREWVLRAFSSPASSPSVAWSRFWWRRAMAGLGNESGAWPWALGRGTIEAGPSGGYRDLRPDRLSRAKLARWRRHLIRVLRS